MERRPGRLRLHPGRAQASSLDTSLFADYVAYIASSYSKFYNNPPHGGAKTPPVSSAPRRALTIP